MNKNYIIIIILALVILGLVAVFLFLPKKPAKTVPSAAKDIEVFMPVPNQPVTSPLKIMGVVRGNGWSGFEGQVGTVKLFDSNNSEMAKGILTANSDWTEPIINFGTDLTFTAPTTDSGKLVFYNENPSGDPARDKTFIVPVKFK